MSSRVLDRLQLSEKRLGAKRSFAAMTVIAVGMLMIPIVFPLVAAGKEARPRGHSAKRTLVIGFAPAEGVCSAAGARSGRNGRQPICIPDGETTYQGAPNASIPWPLTWPACLSAMK